VVKTVQAGLAVDAPSPPEVPDAFAPAEAWRNTVFYSLPNTAGRVFAAVHRWAATPGLLWAEKTAGQPWTDADGRTSTHRANNGTSAALSVRVPVHRPRRLYQRLGDRGGHRRSAGSRLRQPAAGIIGFSDLTLPLVPPGHASRGISSRRSAKSVSAAFSSRNSSPLEPQRAGEADARLGFAGGVEEEHA